MGLLSWLTGAVAVEAGQTAPTVKLADQSGTACDVADSYGRWAVLTFYPKDDTPGCTREAINVTKHLDELTAAGVVVYGVSVQDVKSKVAFCTKYGLKHTLLSDTDKSVCEAYGTLNKFGMANRVTVVLDPARVIRVVDKAVKVDTHSEDLLKTVARLRDEDAARLPALATTSSSVAGITLQLPTGWTQPAGEAMTYTDGKLRLSVSRAETAEVPTLETVTKACCGAAAPKVAEAVKVAGHKAVRVEGARDEATFAATLAWSDGAHATRVTLAGPAAQAAVVSRLLAALAVTIK